MGLLLWHVSFRVSANNAIKRLEAKARAKGEPWTTQDLKIGVYGPIPDEQNAALLLMDLWEEQDPAFWTLFRKGLRPDARTDGMEIPSDLPVVSKSWVPASSSHPLDAENLTKARGFLAKNASFFNGLHRAVLRPKARFPLHFEEGPATLLPHLAKIKDACQMLRLQALVHVADGDIDGAVQATVDAFALAELLRDEPILISQLVRVAGHGCACLSVEDLLNQVPLTPNQLERIEAAAERSEDSRLIWRSLLGERAIMGLVFESSDPFAFVGEDAHMTTKDHAIGVVLSGSGLLQVDRACYLETLEQALQHATEEFPAALVNFGSVFDRFDKSEPPSLETLKTLFSKMLLPALSKSLKRQALADVRRLSVEAAIAVERFRAAHDGATPESLEELVPDWMPAVPKDPFDGKPLRYVRGSTGYLIYSVGADQVDNDGTSQIEARELRSESRRAGKPFDVGEPLQFDETFKVSR